MSKWGLFEHLQNLAANTSRNFKVEYLADNLDVNLYNVFAYTMDPMKKFGLRTLPKVSSSSETLVEVDSLWELLDSLSKINHSNETLELYTNFASKLSMEDKTVLDKILLGDLQCGVMASTLNKAIEKKGANFPQIKAYPCMLCSGFSKKAIDEIFKKSSDRVVCQEKCDGMRFNAIVDIDSNTVDYRGRSGKNIFVNSDAFDKVFLDLARTNRKWKRIVYDGELLVTDKTGSKIIDRKTGNGILNSAIHGTISSEDLKRIHATVWDMIPLEYFKENYYNEIYWDRFTDLKNEFTDLGYDQNRVSLVYTDVVKNFDEAQAIFDRMISEGKEGVILKSPFEIWENKRSANMVKIKGEEECDLRVTDIFVGTKGKVLGKLAKLRARTDDGLLEVDVGSGFSDEERVKFLTMPDLIGKIITVKYNMKIKDKAAKISSLFLPRFIEIREDKDTTNLESEI